MPYLLTAMEAKKRGAAGLTSSVSGDFKREVKADGSAGTAFTAIGGGAGDHHEEIEDFTLTDVLKPLYVCSLPGGQL